MKVQSAPLAEVRPFLRWAGGKRWFARDHRELFPENYDRYFEPFLGSAAVFFALQPTRSVLSDLNGALVETFLAIREDWPGVLRELECHQHSHCREYYYSVRRRSPRSPVKIAARLIYLNRTSFNGIYRVNRRGKFNVPKGNRDSVLFADDDFESVSRTLQGTELLTCDFERTVGRAGQDDFIYVDPPYTVQHNSNNFVRYNERIFKWRDQKRLANTLSAASQRGAKILLSNADHPAIRVLYDSGIWFKLPVQRLSLLASDASRRRPTTELVVTNYRRDYS